VTDIRTTLYLEGEEVEKVSSRVAKAADLQIPPESRAALATFWRSHPALRAHCKKEYGFDPVRQPDDYWKPGLAEPEHADVLREARNKGFTLDLVKRWQREELAEARKDAIEKATNIEAHLRIVGVMHHPSGARVYRLATRDDHYVGRTNPTKARALKNDVVKVTARHVKPTDAGDLAWTNLEVAGLNTGRRADSRRDILARIGGGDITPDMAMVKDDAPPAGDEGTTDPDAVANVPMGPTANSVHVNRPLKNISLFYGRKNKKVGVVKAWGMEQQLVYGVVLEPDVFDRQGDYVPRAHVEKAAHGYLKKALRGSNRVTKLQHRANAFFRDQPSIVPVESFIAPVDFTYQGSNEPVKAGTWVIVLHIEDQDLWDQVTAGHWDGISIGGSGKRTPMGPVGHH
jgi:hypothetical protein